MCFLQWIVKVEKERASEKFSTLERFSWEASGPLFFTMDREGQKTEGFIMIRLFHGIVLARIIPWNSPCKDYSME